MNNNMFPVAPIGLVNLKNGYNRMFDRVWDCWSENSGCLILVQDVEKKTHRVCFTSGTVESTAKEFPPFHRIELIADQSRRRIGGWSGWSVVGVFPYTKEGMLRIRDTASKTSLPFATFK